MANRPELTFTPFDRDAGLRESFLYQLRQQERDILIRLVDCMLELAREGHCVDDYPEPPICAELGAIAKDLRFLEALMNHIVSYEDEHSPGLWHARLLICVAELAPQVGALADGLEAELMAVVNQSEHR